MSPFLAGLRDKVGHDLLLVPAAGVAVFDDDGRLLLGRHVDIDAWSTLGGMVEPAERPEDAALRELAEETGLRGEIVDLLGAYGGPEFQTRYPNGDRIAYVATVYVCRLVDGDGDAVLEREEISELGWFDRRQAATLDLPPHMHRIVPDAFDWWTRHG